MNLMSVACTTIKFDALHISCVKVVRMQNLSLALLLMSNGQMK